MLIPLIKLFKKKEQFEVIVIGLTTAAARLMQENISCYSYKDYLKLFPEEKVVECGKRLAGDSNNSGHVPYEESVAYLGINYFELVETYGKDCAAELYRERGRGAFYPVESMKKILSSIGPDIVISTNSPRSEKATIEAAGKLKIPSVCLIDVFAFQSKSWIADNRFASKVCVLSNFVKQQLVDEGRRETDVVVTGNPVFDKLTLYKKSFFRDRWGNAKRVILWCSQVEPMTHPFDNSRFGDPELPRNIEKHLFQIISDHDDWILILRPHPSECFSYGKLPYNVVVSDKSDDLHELIASVDIVITMTSTVAIEAALIGKPVVTVDLSIFTKDTPFSKMKLSKGVTDLNELESLMEQLSLSAESKNRVANIVGIPDDATKKISKVIRDLLD